MQPQFNIDDGLLLCQLDDEHNHFVVVKVRVYKITIFKESVKYDLKKIADGSVIPGAIQPDYSCSFYEDDGSNLFRTVEAAAQRLKSYVQAIFDYKPDECVEAAQ